MNKILLVYLKLMKIKWLKLADWQPHHSEFKVIIIMIFVIIMLIIKKQSLHVMKLNKPSTPLVGRLVHEDVLGVQLIKFL